MITVTAVLLWSVTAANIGKQVNVATALSTQADYVTGDKLYDASGRGNLAEVRRLTADNCTDVNKQSGYYKRTPLYHASRGQHTQVVMWLLSCYADPNIKSSEGVTPLYVASKYANVDIVRALLAAHCEIDVQTIRYGTTALMTASRRNQIAVVKELITAGAQINQKTNKYSMHNNEGEGDEGTALMYAARYAHVNMTNTLLNYGADINIQDNDGKTSLHIAVEYNRIEQVKTLLQHGANARIESKAGETVKDIAKKHGFMDILQVIEKYTETTTVNINTPEDANTTADACVMNGHTKGNNDATAISKHIMPGLVICLLVVIFTLVISMIVGCVYFRYKHHMVASSQMDAVIFKNEENWNSQRIYEN